MFRYVDTYTHMTCETEAKEINITYMYTDIYIYIYIYIYIMYAERAYNIHCADIHVNT